MNKHHWSTSFFIGAFFLSLNAQAINSVDAVGRGQVSFIDESLQVSFINVGYGDSTLIRDPSGFDILIDGGKSVAGPDVIAYLRDQGVDSIEVMISTHADSDSVGGLIEVLEHSDISVESVLYNGYPGDNSTWREFEKAVAFQGLTLTAAQYPLTYTWGTTTAHILNPLPNLTSPDQNEASVVILLAHENVDFLFTGDINASIEKEILTRRKPLAAEILKVPFNGSQNASSDEFLSAVQPSDAVISVGSNLYGHPADETIDRLLAFGTQIWRTDESGTIVIISDGRTYDISALGIPATSTVQESATTQQPEATIVSTATPTSVPNPIILWIQNNREKAWFKPLVTISRFATTLLIGVLALLLLASKAGSAIFDRHWLIALAAKPLLITPGLGKWALFLGYKQRLKSLPGVEKAAKDYFGLPAKGPSGILIKPDPKGDSLHTTIAEALGPQTPILLVGRGGAGKSTILARWVHLSLSGFLAESLRGYQPILVTPAYYKGNLVRAITDVLRERDGVATTEDIVRSQLSSGKYLVLFDGVSEVESDKVQALEEILRTARNADYRRCRFLIATRPIEGTHMQDPSFELQPLTKEVIEVLLPRYGLGTEGIYNVRQQLESFGDRAIEPLLLAMMLDQSASEQISQNRAQLYERYFRRLLHVEIHEDWWLGWRRALEVLSQWFMLDTGRRGVGLPREPLLQRMLKEDELEWSGSKSLVELMKRFYDIPIERPLELLQRLKSAGIMVEERRWRFAHDTFEEYFAASRVVSMFAEFERWPEVTSWVDKTEQVLDFLDVLAFVREMERGEFLIELAKADIPPEWRDYLIGKLMTSQPEAKRGGAFLTGAVLPIEPE